MLISYFTNFSSSFSICNSFTEYFLVMHSTPCTFAFPILFVNLSESASLRLWLDFGEEKAVNVHHISSSQTCSQKILPSVQSGEKRV